MEFRSLPGYPPYEKVRELQLELVQKRIEDQIPDTVLFLEHSPVITRGRGLQWTGVARPRSMPFNPELLRDIEFAESERGGDLTYHGPGQLVVYPIVKLDGKGFGPARDVVGFLRKVENVFIQTLDKKGVKAESKQDATGIWVGDRKIASIGIAVRKWVTYHGIALNCVNDLQPFHLISPCGYAPEVMTRVTDLIPMGTQWRREFELGLTDAFLQNL